MRATFIYGAGDVRVETAPDPVLQQAGDAIVRIVRACICGSDLHPYHSMPAQPEGRPMGHEFLGVVEETGSEVTTLEAGDFVIGPFAWSGGTCEFCREGLQTSCERGGFWGNGGTGGAQAEAIRVPLADGTLVAVPGIDEDDAVLPSLLTLSDVYGTGYHAAKQARIARGDTVAVIGDGAVGLLAVLSRQLGAERIILMGRHPARTDLGIEFGATDVVAERGQEGIDMVRELSGGTAPTRSSKPSGTCPPTSRRSASSARAASSAGWGSPSTTTHPSASPPFSVRTSRSPVDRPPLRLHRGTAPRRARRHREAGQGLRSHRRSRGRPRRLPGHGQAGGAQGADPAIAAVVRPTARRSLFGTGPWESGGGPVGPEDPPATAPGR